MSHGQRSYISGAMKTESYDVIIVGAGISGIAAAYHIKRKCPNRRIRIIEARDTIGGTWDLFRYPGIRSDSDMYTFGFAFRPWTDGKVFADGPSIRKYVNETAQESEIEKDIQFGYRVTAAEWSSTEAKWSLRAQSSHSEEVIQYTCQFVVMCSGYYRYDKGHLPAFPGMENFTGDIIHPQFWKEGTDYKNKKVIVIGSGATAITLVPAMVEDAAKITMLQRSPSYIAARPSRDAMVDFLSPFLPPKLTHALARTKNVLLAIYFYQVAQKFPELVRREVKRRIKDELGDDFDVEKHFNPRYAPWDQRFCLAPDGDFFAALKSEKAEIVTDTIESFVEEGIRLSSGEVLEADLIIPATGLELQLFGGCELSIDGAPFVTSDSFTYRGMMLSGLPNLAIALGYTNSSWTLKVDLTCERVCRVLNHLEKTGSDYCVAEPQSTVNERPLLDLSSGYVSRAKEMLPKQSDESPWRTYQNYIQDMLSIRFSPIDDGTLIFRNRSQSETTSSVVDELPTQEGLPRPTNS
ncbi:MAG: NAD(P)/FAD-dependent oxidoreductase [Myxococcota bacterium]|nr:NAD(P)/FAD-dependent oxidoreductase [Myxococcota bacterium]